VVIDEIGQGMKKGLNTRTVIKALRPQVDDALDRIAEGLNCAGPA
jgi:hypothetical protein